MLLSANCGVRDGLFAESRPRHSCQICLRGKAFQGALWVESHHKPHAVIRVTRDQDVSGRFHGAQIGGHGRDQVTVEEHVGWSLTELPE